MQKLRIFSVTFILLLSVLGAYAQSAADANTYFNNEQYQQAFEAYKNLSAKKPKDKLYQYRLGYSAYMIGEEQVAINSFEKSADRYPHAYYLLGELFFKNYRFEDAADAYDDFLDEIDAGNQYYAEAERRLAQSEQAARLLRRVEDIEIIDSIVVNKADFLRYIQPTPDVGKLQQENHIIDGKAHIAGTYTSQRGDRMYCARPNKGKFDLFTKTRLLDNWDEAEVIKDLLSDYNENFPFLMLDGVTLYFASDNEESIGGYDIFITRLNISSGKYLKPENVGMPFNSPYNDYIMVIDELNNVGWFASDRYQPENKVAIYQFIPNKETKIIRTDDEDFLIEKARISNFKAKKGSYRYFTKESSDENVSNKLIFIDENIILQGDKDFKNKQARNYYFQAEKLMDEVNALENKLEEMRASYYNASAANKSKIGGDIRNAEIRLRQAKPQIEQLMKQMRIAEIKSRR